MRSKTESLTRLSDEREACLVLAGATEIDPLPEIAVEMSELRCESVIGGE